MIVKKVMQAMEAKKAMKGKGKKAMKGNDKKAMKCNGTKAMKGNGGKAMKGNGMKAMKRQRHEGGGGGVPESRLHDFLRKQTVP